jgi:hypothetical protein
LSCTICDKNQSSRVKTTKKGLVTLLDEKGKEIVSYYQISLKKTFVKARVGRATTFINKNYVGGVSLGSITQASDLNKLVAKFGGLPKVQKVLHGYSQQEKSPEWIAKKMGEVDEDDEVIWPDVNTIKSLLKQGFGEELTEGRMYELYLEGWFSDVFSKFKDVVSGGFKNFVGWAKKKYTKVAQVLVRLSVKLSNQKIKRNRGMKSISNILNMTQLNESSLTSFLGEKKSPEIEVTKTLVKEFKTLSEFVKNDEINKLHKENMTLLNSLNDKFAVPGRKVSPILMLPNEDRKSTRLNSSHVRTSRMPSSA